MQITDFKIGTRIGAGFATLVVLTLLLGLLSMTQLSNVASTTESIATGNLPTVQLMGELRDLLNNIRRNESRHLLSSSRKEMKALETQMAAGRKKLIEMDSVIAKRLTTDAEKHAMASFVQQRQLWITASEQMAPLSRAGKQDEATNLYNGESNTAFDLAMIEVIKLSDMSSRESGDAWEMAKVTYGRAQLAVAVAVALAVLMAVAMALLISRSIARPIQAAVAAAREIADGDMTVELRVQGSDETAQLLESLEAMRARLSQVVSAVRDGSDLLAVASAEIADGNQDLSERTERQASALQHTAVSMQHLGEKVRENTDSAQRGDQLAQTASSVAERSSHAFRQVVTTMRDIDESSRKIADITSIIDGIAFQTNILALNAAVEAARAGTQGRGFAVVAAEVRTLAGRSARAAQEIKALIHTSVERVRNGSDLVDQAGETLREVEVSIRRVSAIMGEITTASRDQLAGVSEVGDSVSQLDTTTQQNAKLVQSIAAAAGLLKDQAAGLVKTAAVFKVDATDERTDEGQTHCAEPEYFN